MAKRLEGKVAVVTGAGSPVGIGKEIALLMAAEGAKVVVNDIGKSPEGKSGADMVVEQIKAAGGEAAANYDSVASMEGGRAIIKTAIDRFGKIDILVNTAGNFKITPTIDFEEKDWDAIMAVHVKGLFACTQAAIKEMIKQGTGGRIINFTSIAAYTSGMGPGPSIAYCTAKAAVLGFTRTTSMELAQYGITVNAISPGATTALFPGRIIDGVRRTGPGPEYIAPVVAYLATDDAKDITSQVILVRGSDMTVYAPIMQTPGAHQYYHKNGKWTIDELEEIMPKIVKV
jgi:NAD(P)-dependent dehydrogenase (short-subunit alcohol dehydrogenase family)